MFTNCIDSQRNRIPVYEFPIIVKYNDDNTFSGFIPYLNGCDVETKTGYELVKNLRQNILNCILKNNKIPCTPTTQDLYKSIKNHSEESVDVILFSKEYLEEHLEKCIFTKEINIPYNLYKEAELKNIDLEQIFIESLKEKLKK